MSDVIEYPAPNLSLVMPPESTWERERRAFRALLPELRANYEGQFVAIKDGNVVASGSDEVAVALEAYSRALATSRIILVMSPTRPHTHS